MKKGREFQSIIEKMQDQYGIEAVVLGCTELPLLLNSENCSVPCLDSVEIHISDLISEALGIRGDVEIHHRCL